MGAVLNEGRQLPGIACVVVKPVGVADAYRLRSFWSQKSVVDGAGRAVPLQGVFTGEVLTSLFSISEAYVICFFSWPSFPAHSLGLPWCLCP